MTIPVNKISIDVYQHETEEKIKIFSGLQYLFPPEFHSELDKIFMTTNLTGYHDNEIIKYSCELHKGKEAELLFLFLIKKILQNFSYFDLLDRISEDGELFIRLNKQKLIFNGSFSIDNSSDVYKIIIKFLFFNKKVKKVESIYEYLKTIS